MEEVWVKLEMQFGEWLDLPWIAPHPRDTSTVVHGQIGPDMVSAIDQ
jgi:hypothetical protein